MAVNARFTIRERGQELVNIRSIRRATGCKQHIAFLLPANAGARISLSESGDYFLQAMIGHPDNWMVVEQDIQAHGWSVLFRGTYCECLKEAEKYVKTKHEN